MIQIVKTNYAYPISYLTYGNIDFGTVKGFSALYELRRTEIHLCLRIILFNLLMVQDLQLHLVTV